jgi:hypothetical protein
MRTARAIVNDPSTITGLASNDVFIGGAACVGDFTGYEGKVITRFGSIWKPRDPIVGEVIVLTDPDPMEEWQRVGSDWVLKRVVLAVELDFGSVASGAAATQTVTVTGATTDNGAFVSPADSVDDGIEFRAAVTADDTVTVKALNRTASPITADNQPLTLLIAR